MPQLQREISSRQFAEWMAYYAIEPFGEERADLRMAMLASVIANANRDPQKRREPFTPADFMLKFESPDGEGQTHGSAPTQTWEQQKTMMQALTIRQRMRPSHQKTGIDP